MYALHLKGSFHSLCEVFTFELLNWIYNNMDVKKVTVVMALN